MKRTELFLALILFMMDAIMVAVGFFLAYHVRLRTEYPPPVQILPFADYLPMLALHTLAMLSAFVLSRLYLYRRGSSRIDEVYNIFAASSVGIVLSVAVTSFVLKSLDYPRLMIVYSWLFTIILVSTGRLVIRLTQSALRARGVGIERVVIIGAGRVGQRLLETIKGSPQLGYRVVGFIDNDASIRAVDGVPVLGTAEDIPRVLKETQASEVLVALPHAPHEEILNIVGLCEPAHVNVRVFPDLFHIIASEVSINDLNGIPLVSVRDVALRGWRLAVKRLIDVMVSSIVLVLFSPFMMLTALLIKLDSPGSVFYLQERVGLDGRPFLMIKFRSMRADAEQETGPVWASRNDPRRTRLGRILRRLSLDEFPQFINVLLGDMSIVGPRPERPVFVEQFRKQIPRYMERHKEKAGITGWAQVNGLRGDSSIEERTRYDLWYVENWSLLLDFKIMLRTAIEVVRGRNAR